MGRHKTMPKARCGNKMRSSIRSGKPKLLNPGSGLSNADLSALLALPYRVHKSPQVLSRLPQESRWIRTTDLIRSIRETLKDNPGSRLEIRLVTSSRKNPKKPYLEANHQTTSTRVSRMPCSS